MRERRQVKERKQKFVREGGDDRFIVAALNGEICAWRLLNHQVCLSLVAD